VRALESASPISHPSYACAASLWPHITALPLSSLTSELHHAGPRRREEGQASPKLSSKKAHPRFPTPRTLALFPWPHRTSPFSLALELHHAGPRRREEGQPSPKLSSPEVHDGEQDDHEEVEMLLESYAQEVGIGGFRFSTVAHAAYCDLAVPRLGTISHSRYPRLVVSPF
jgi:hypothetical protein